MLVEAHSVLEAGLINQAIIFLENTFKFEEVLISLGILFHIIVPEYERLALNRT